MRYPLTENEGETCAQSAFSPHCIGAAHLSSSSTLGRGSAALSELLARLTRPWRYGCERFQQCSMMGLSLSV